MYYIQDKIHHMVRLNLHRSILQCVAIDAHSILVTGTERSAARMQLKYPDDGSKYGTDRALPNSTAAPIPVHIYQHDSDLDSNSSDASSTNELQ